MDARLIACGGEREEFASKRGDREKDDKDRQKKGAKCGDTWATVRPKSNHRRGLMTFKNLKAEGGFRFRDEGGKEDQRGIRKGKKAEDCSGVQEKTIKARSTGLETVRLSAGIRAERITEWEARVTGRRGDSNGRIEKEWSKNQGRNAKVITAEPLIPVGEATEKGRKTSSKVGNCREEESIKT